MPLIRLRKYVDYITGILKEVIPDIEVIALRVPTTEPTMPYALIKADPLTSPEDGGPIWDSFWHRYMILVVREIPDEETDLAQLIEDEVNELVNRFEKDPHIDIGDEGFYGQFPTVTKVWVDQEEAEENEYAYALLFTFLQESSRGNV